MMSKMKLSSFLGMIILALGFLWLLYNYGIKGGQYRNFLETVSSENIEKIEFYSLDTKGIAESRISVIEDKVAIEKIASFLADAKSYFPNHPSYEQEVYSIFYLQSGEKIGLVIQLLKSPDNTVYIEFVSKNGASTSFYGNAKIEGGAFLKYLNSIGILYIE